MHSRASAISNSVAPPTRSSLPRLHSPCLQAMRPRGRFLCAHTQRDRIPQPVRHNHHGTTSTPTPPITASPVPPTPPPVRRTTTNKFCSLLSAPHLHRGREERWRPADGRASRRASRRASGRASSRAMLHQHFFITRSKSHHEVPLAPHSPRSPTASTAASSSETSASSAAGSRGFAPSKTRTPVP